MDETPVSREEVARVEERFAALGQARSMSEDNAFTKVRRALGDALDSGRRAQSEPFGVEYHQIARSYLSIADTFVSLIERSRQMRRPNTSW